MNAERQQPLLVVNTGSSTVKYKLLDMPSGTLRLHGIIEQPCTDRSRHRLFSDEGALADDTCSLGSIDAACALIAETVSRHLSGKTPRAIGHRVVHGGDRYLQPVIVDDGVLAELGQLDRLAPLHNPGNLQGIAFFLRHYPACPQVAVFDTAFHHSLPDYAYRYAVDADWYRRHGIRRYGFHGTSHEFVAHEAATLLQRPLSQLKLISLHLGNGASACAIRHGLSIDTSMGFTPLEGLMMGSRCGDLDPDVPLFLQQQAGLDPDTLRYRLEHESGLKGIAGSSDMRELLAREDDDARLALDMFCYRVRKYIGAYCAVLGHVDALIFTGGIGENAPQIRQRCCDNLAGLGLEIDAARNADSAQSARFVSPQGAVTPVLVIPTDEGLQIARHVLATLNPAAAPVDA